RIQIIINEQGRSNIPVSTTASTGESIDWLVLKLRSTGGSLNFEDRSQDASVNLPVWNISIDGSRLAGTQEIHFQTDQLARVRYGGKAITAHTIDARVTLKDRNATLDVQRASISSDLADLQITGTVNNLNDPSLALALISQVHLEPTVHHFSIPQKFEGDLAIDASLNGRPNDLKIAARIKGEDLRAEAFDRITVDADVAGDLASQRAHINSLQVRSPNLSVSGTADLALAESAGESRIDATLDAADLESISKTLRL